MAQHSAMPAFLLVTSSPGHTAPLHPSFLPLCFHKVVFVEVSIHLYQIFRQVNGLWLSWVLFSLLKVIAWKHSAIPLCKESEYLDPVHSSFVSLWQRLQLGLSPRPFCYIFCRLQIIAIAIYSSFSFSSSFPLYHYHSLWTMMRTQHKAISPIALMY